MTARKKPMEEAALSENSTQENMETAETEKETVETEEMEESKRAAGSPLKDYENKEEMVAIKLFRDNDKYTEPLFVGVNGKSYLIKRGETVMVPKSVAEVIENSENQLMYMSKVQKELESVQYKELE